MTAFVECIISESLYIERVPNCPISYAGRIELLNSDSKYALSSEWPLNVQWGQSSFEVIGAT